MLATFEKSLAADLRHVNSNHGKSRDIPKESLDGQNKLELVYSILHVSLPQRDYHAKFVMLNAGSLIGLSPAVWDALAFCMIVSRLRRKRLLGTSPEVAAYKATIAAISVLDTLTRMQNQTNYPRGAG